MTYFRRSSIIVNLVEWETYHVNVFCLFWARWERKHRKQYFEIWFFIEILYDSCCVWKTLGLAFPHAKTCVSCGRQKITILDFYFFRKISIHSSFGVNWNWWAADFGNRTYVMGVGSNWHFFLLKIVLNFNGNFLHELVPRKLSFNSISPHERKHSSGRSTPTWPPTSPKLFFSQNCHNKEDEIKKVLLEEQNNISVQSPTIVALFSSVL